ncbi:hypothetical protein [Kineobactrum salinum]|uniref:Exo-alpha-sialidase n=1 Tax=Kineobactrum salinum TaxID=2708301 RepID=A0A6C0U258_9GAMM|nr:hypothetical protein [Kineobactrum salinum]QIB65559.1 hypothetical protein G3T16_09235 [Kineobactrum salinum]
MNNRALDSEFQGEGSISPVLRKPVFRFCAPVVGALVMLGGCSNPDEAQADASATTDTPRQTAFRIRSDFDAALNADTGWAAGLNQPAVAQADQQFRLRFEVEGAADTNSGQQFQLQYRRNKGSWEPLTAEDHPYPIKEVALDFSSEPATAPSETWSLLQGAESALSWQQEGDEGFLRVVALESPVLAVADYDTHWEAVESKFGMRLPPSSRAGIVFGYKDEDNHYRVDLAAGGAISIVRRGRGQESLVAKHEVGVKADQWFELAVVRDRTEVVIEYEWDPYIEGLSFSEDLGESIPESRAALYVPAGSTAELQFVEVEGETHSPGTSIVSNPEFDYGDKTEDILPGSTAPFTGGAGIDYAETTPSWSAAGGHSEWEFPVVIRYFYDGPSMNEKGDTFEYRMVDVNGNPLQAEHNPLVTLDVPERHLGGVFVETPVRVGPWQASNGDLYFLQEPAETDNFMMSVKSTDGGQTWREVDGANRPQTGDLEGVAQTHVGDTIHTLHQTSDHVFYHVFRTSDHPSAPDTWAVTDERLASPTEPPVQVADLAVRSDGSVVGVYGNLEKILFRIRSPQGQWSGETVIDADVEPNLSGPVIVRGEGDTVHLAYTGIDGTAWYRQILPNGDLTARKQLASGLGTTVQDSGGILPLVYLPESDSVSIIYRLDNGELWERRADGEGELSDAVQVTSRAVVMNAADAEQVGADAIGYGSSVHVLFIEEDTGRIFHTLRENDSWSEPKLEIDGVNALWVRGNVVSKDNEDTVYGYVYDAGSMGGSGMNKYAEVPLPAH